MKVKAKADCVVGGIQRTAGEVFELEANVKLRREGRQLEKVVDAPKAVAKPVVEEVKEEKPKAKKKTKKKD